MKLELVAATTFGLEAVARRELEALGYSIISTEDGKVTFSGTERDICRTNLWLRTADRVQIKMAEFRALEFEDLFQNVKGIAWEEWIPTDGRFVVNGSSVKSKLSSVPAIQSVSEKAVVERLSECYGIEHFEKSGAAFEIKITNLKDRVTVTLDTTGDGLNKRGYRKLKVKAPIKETIAAALIQLSFWREDRILADPCCGSGTIPIEAAMMAKNIAPGLNRRFAAEEWPAIPTKYWEEERKRAYDSIRPEVNVKIFGSDIDPNAIRAARVNAAEAGVGDIIHFNVADVSAMKTKALSGVWITNPPYGERIGDKAEIDKIYEAYRTFFKENPTWSLFAVTSDKSIEKKAMGRPADRRRKLYNGNIEVCYYQFYGIKP